MDGSWDVAARANLTLLTLVVLISVCAAYEVHCLYRRYGMGAGHILAIASNVAICLCWAVALFALIVLSGYAAGR